MPEDKKPNLKDRLKKTTAAAVSNPGAAVGPPGGAVVAPTSSGSLPPPPVAAIPGIPGIPGLSNNVAPPAFVQQQQAHEAARQRAAAAAADPFGAAASAPAAGPQEVRLVIDDKAVADHEVGRKSTGTIIAVAMTAVVALGGGYALGGLMESKNQEHQTLSAVTNVRNDVTRLGDVINGIKTHVDHAVERGNIVVRSGDDDSGGGGAAPTHPPDVDDDLISWFQQQPSDPPFTPDSYAGRVGRLKTAVVSKLTVVQLQFNEAWRQLGVLSRMNPTVVRQAMNASGPGNPMRGAVVAFARAQPDSPLVAQIVTSGQPTPQGQVPISGQGIPANQSRTAYQTGPLTEQTITNMVVLVQPNVGIGPSIVRAETMQWDLYRQRIADLKQLVDQLVQNQQQLMDQLAGHAGG